MVLNAVPCQAEDENQWNSQFNSSAQEGKDAEISSRKGASWPNSKGIAQRAINDTNTKGLDSESILLLRIKKLEDQVNELEAEVGILTSQTRIMIERGVFSPRDSSYFKAGFNLLLPRNTSFNFSTDSGIGAFVGVGRYLGSRHILELRLDWDIFVGATLTYRFEIKTNGGLSFGPQFGIKQKIFNVEPFDNFISKPTLLRKTFYIVGVGAGIPISGSSLIQTDLHYVTNSQTFFVANGSVHLFF